MNGMILPDVNVLLYAFRRDSLRHAEYRNWLEEVANGDRAYGMANQRSCQGSLGKLKKPGKFALIGLRSNDNRKAIYAVANLCFSKLRNASL